MTFDDDNRLTDVDGNAVNNDPDGNMTNGPLSNDTLFAYTYDARNRLVSAGGLGYTYDPVGNRTAVTNGAAVTKYVINPNAKLSQVLMRIQNGVTNYYVYGAGLLYQVTETATSTNTLTYHYDYRGSTVALADTNGNVTDRIEYSAYATMTYRGGTNDTPFLFNGRYGVMTDPNGLLYMRARYYNPYICRFLNSDPSGFSGGLNFYTYANGNPVSYEDPMGLQIPSPATGVMGWSDATAENPAAWDMQFQAVNQQAGAIEASVVAGAAVGAAGAAVVTVAAPAAASGLVATGFFTPAAASATVTTTLYAGGAVGGGLAAANVWQNAKAGNVNAVAFDVGTLWGAGFVGGVGGGRYIANNASPKPSTVPYSMDPFTADAGYGFERNSSLPYLIDRWNWLGTGPTPTGGGEAAIGISSGASLFLPQSGASWLNPFSGSSGQSSSTGK